MNECGGGGLVSACGMLSGLEWQVKSISRKPI